MSIKIYVPFIDESTDDIIMAWLYKLPAIRYAWDDSAMYVVFEYEEDAIAFKLKFEL